MRCDIACDTDAQRLASAGHRIVMYRDELAAATARADALERELDLLRQRNAQLESGDRATIEARENARRLEAALERETDELRRRFEQELERERDRLRLESEHRVTRRPAATALEHTRMRATANLVVGGILGMIALACEQGSVAVLAVTFVMIGGLVLVSGVES